MQLLVCLCTIFTIEDAVKCHQLAIIILSHIHVDLSEIIATIKALEKITGKRSFVISPSAFPGSGGYGGHWTGKHDM